MHSQFAQRARQALFAPRPRLEGPRSAGPSSGERSQRHTGTTILALRFDEGIMLAADRQVTGYNSVMSDECVKIERITDESALLSCGLVSSGQLIEDALKVHCRSFNEATGYTLSVRGQLQFAANLSREACAYYGWWGWSFGGILAGREVDESFSLYAISDDGARETPAYFTADGSGFRFARTVMQMRWRHGLAHVDALRIAMEALYYAGRNDLYTSDLRTTTPTAASVMASGVSFIGDDAVRAMADEVIATAGRYL
jgi:20S proteasome alpha/beta subunit